MTVRPWRPDVPAPPAAAPPYASAPRPRRYGGRVALVRRADPADLDALLPLVAEFCAIGGHEFAPARVGSALRPLLADDGLGQVWMQRPL